MTADNRSVHAVCCFLNPILPPDDTQSFCNAVFLINASQRSDQC